MKNEGVRIIYAMFVGWVKKSSNKTMVKIKI
jgi:hypothetical protein